MTTPKQDAAARVAVREAIEGACESLHRVLSTPAHSDDLEWGSSLRAAVNELFVAIQQHRDITEAEDGPLNEMLRRKPALRRHIERQRREHGELIQKAEELADESREMIHFKHLDVDLLRLAGAVLNEGVRLHLYRATNLVYEAFFQEEGGEEG